jgi:hypothetical protein
MWRAGLFYLFQASSEFVWTGVFVKRDGNWVSVRGQINSVK